MVRKISINVNGLENKRDSIFKHTISMGWDWNYHEKMPFKNKIKHIQIDNDILSNRLTHIQITSNETINILSIYAPSKCSTPKNKLL